MKASLKTQSQKIWVALLLGLALTYGCSSGQASTSDTKTDSSSAAGGDGKSASADEIVAPENPDGFSASIGAVVKASATEIDLKVKDQTLAIMLTDSVRIYATSPGTLADVKNAAFVGAATKKQADGSDQAFRIFTFPEELRGLNEGSFMLDGSPDPNGGRMTNGSASRMTNGSASRMSNGSVKKTDGSSLTIQYQGHSRTVNVPPNTPVVEYKITDKKLKPGDKVLALTKESDNGTYKSSKILFL